MEISQNYIEGLIEKYGDMVLRISYTYLKNKPDAEDVVQDVFLKVIDKKPNFNDENHEKSWFIRTAINMCKNKLNLFWNKNKCSIDAAADFSTYDKYRITVYMHYYEGYSTPEISKLLNKPEATVRSLLSRARTKLKNILKEDYDFEQ